MKREDERIRNAKVKEGEYGIGEEGGNRIRGGGEYRSNSDQIQQKVIFQQYLHFSL